ncbi:hypothetical protein [Streptomyces nigra]|uniref:hypothetical protein n=1 Tax=Streptomyces nigra TaxID=1827580 RepID=UPI0037FF1FA9
MTAPLTLRVYDSLTYAQHQGWACVFCSASLAAGGRSVGRAVSADGRDSIEVYACKQGCGGVTPPQDPAHEEVR